MSRDADTVRAVIVRDVWPENDFANSAARLSGSDCPGRRSALAALARLEARAAQRDALAKALRQLEAEFVARGGLAASPADVAMYLGIARAALAEAATREETT